MTLGASASLAGPRCTTEGGPVDQGQFFHGVRCNYVACYCSIRKCAGRPPWITCQKLKMKFH
jgi:hypothetical protein